MENYFRDDLMFYITKSWIQYEAENKINRRLTEKELYSVRNSLEWGLLDDIDAIFDIAIEYAVEGQIKL